MSGMNPNLPVRYGASFVSNTVLAVNTPQQVVAPASNVNGIVVWLASLIGSSTGGVDAALLAKSAAPATSVDGVVLMQGNMPAYAGTYWVGGGRLNRAVFVPAGLGLYFIRGTLEASGHRSVLYTIL